MRVVTLGVVAGVEVRAPPVGGVVWDRGRLLRLGRGGGIAWELALDEPPRLALEGRRLYVAWGAQLGCLDHASGALVWLQDLPGTARAIAAHAGGVEVLVGGAILTVTAHGTVETPIHTGLEAGRLLRLGRTPYLATEDGIWRMEADLPPERIGTGALHAWYDRGGELEALVVSERGTVLLSEQGATPFPAASTHHLAPWGLAGWAVAPRAGVGGVWVVDRDLKTAWKRAIPGEIRGLAVVGRAIAVAVEDGEPALGLIHPDVSDVLLLASDAFADPLTDTPAEPSGDGPLHAEGEVLYLTQRGRTAMFLVRES